MKKNITFLLLLFLSLQAFSQIKTEKIDGIDFQMFTITLYSPNGEVILNQIYYSSLINGL